ncbi:hypothetical protein D3C85_1710700 [compost metagenome]
MATGAGGHDHVAQGAHAAVFGLVEVGEGHDGAVAFHHRGAAALGDGVGQLGGGEGMGGFGKHVEQLVRALREGADDRDVAGLDGAVGQVHGRSFCAG